MTTTTNTRIRFCDNNFGALITASIEKSSELAAFPVTNAVNSFRSKVYKPSGYFNITTSNQNIYITDNAVERTIAVTVGEYTTPVLLAAQIATDINAAATNTWTCTYDGTTTPTYKFTIGSSASTDILRYSVTTNAMWDAIGYIGTTDTTSDTFIADAQRNHTSEYVTFDLGYNAPMEFFAVISPLSEVFSLSESASSIKLYANNLNDWTSPPLSITLTRTDNGIFRFMDDLSDSSYRFWRFEYVDRLNPSGPEGISFGHIYIGDYTTITSRNYASKFTKEYKDPTGVSESLSGARYFDTKTKYLEINGGKIQFMEAAQRRTLEQLFHDLGLSTPFYISLDPTVCNTATLDELTKYVYFSREPQFVHFKADIYSLTGLDFRESV